VEATLALFKELESDVAQGWTIGKPMPTSALEALLGDGRRLAA
jgi:EAL domain-containing protein (putative c-di-GMP-specific phosphodiesterase class I)